MSSSNLTTSSSSSATRRIAVPKAISTTAAASSRHRMKRSIDPDESVSLALNHALDSMWGDFLGENSAKKRKAPEPDSLEGEPSSWPPPIAKRCKIDPETTSTTNDDKAATANDSLKSIGSTPSTPIQVPPSTSEPIQAPPSPSTPIQVPPLGVQPGEQVSKRKMDTTPFPISPAARYIIELQKTVIDCSSEGVLAFADADEVQLHDIRNGHRSSLGYTFDCTITTVSFHPSGRILAVGTRDLDCTKRTMVRFFDFKRKKLLTTLRIPAEDGAITAVAWHPLRSIISIGTFEGCLYHFNVLGDYFQSKKPCVLKRNSAHHRAVYGLTWSPDGSLLASSDADGHVCVWRLKSLVSPVYQHKHRYGVEALAWCTWNPHLLAFGGDPFDREIHVWNSETGSLAKTFKSGAQVTSLH